MGSYNRHQCVAGRSPVAWFDVPPYAAPGSPVYFPETRLFGRARLLRNCCGTLLVETMVVPGDPDNGATRTDGFVLSDIAPVPDGADYSVPCAGAPWSLNLPCGHLAGEGCDCDTIALEAAQEDDDMEDDSHFDDGRPNYASTFWDGPV